MVLDSIAVHGNKFNFLYFGQTVKHGVDTKVKKIGEMQKNGISQH